MKPVCLILVLMAGGFPLFLRAQPGKEVTEEDVVKILDGEHKKVPATQPPALAFGVFYPLSSPAASSGQYRSAESGRQIEEFYKKLIPLGRALESEALQGFHFTLTVYASPHVPGDQEGALALKVAEEVRHFLTTYFAIAPERLVIQAGKGLFPPTGARAESTGMPGWRMEIGRLD